MNESSRIMEETLENVGAGVVGRNMFGPVGGGARLFDDLGAGEIALEQVRAVAAPGVTHVTYRVGP